MNPLVMWIRAHRAERLALAVLLIVVLAVLWQVASSRGGSPPARQARTAVTTPAATVPTAAPAPQLGSTPAAQDLAAATDGARNFLMALETYSFGDSPTSTGSRVRPYVTDALYTSYFSGPTNAAAHMRPDLREVDTPTVTELTSEGFGADGSLGFLARVSVNVKTDQSTSTHVDRFEVFLTQVSTGWRVNAFTVGATTGP